MYDHQHKEDFFLSSSNKLHPFWWGGEPVRRVIVGLSLVHKMKSNKSHSFSFDVVRRESCFVHWVTSWDCTK